MENECLPTNSVEVARAKTSVNTNEDSEEQSFAKAVKYVRLSSRHVMSNKTKLHLYALYKIATFGRYEKNSDTKNVNFTWTRKGIKLRAWRDMSRDCKSREDAITKYIACLEKIEPNWRQELETLTLTSKATSDNEQDRNYNEDSENDYEDEGGDNFADGDSNFDSQAAKLPSISGSIGRTRHESRAAAVGINRRLLDTHMSARFASAVSHAAAGKLLYPFGAPTQMLFIWYDIFLNFLNK